MKIIFITRENYDMPAARIRCYNFANQLKQLGVEIEIFSYADSLHPEKKEHELNFFNKIKFNLEAFKKLVKRKKSIFFLQRFNYHSFGPYIACCLNKNKLILDLDDWEMRENPRYLLRFWPTSKADALTKYIAKNATACIAASKVLFDYLKEYNQNVYYLPSGVDTDLFYPNGCKRDVGKVVFAWIGTMHRLDNVENIKFIVECFRVLADKYKNISLEITGSGIYEPEVVRLIRQTGVNNICLNQWIHPSQMPCYLDKIDIGLLPLTQKTKFNLAKSPVKLFEYMAMTKATVSSCLGEAARIIQDGVNGFLAGNKDEFIAKMEFLINNPDKRVAVGQAARNTALNFSLPVLGRELFNIIRKV